MGTKEVIERLPENVVRKIEDYRKRYTVLSNKLFVRSGGKYWELENTRSAMSAYALGLRDARVITEQERKVIFVYMTISVSGPDVARVETDAPKRRKGIPLEENDSGYNCENWIP